MPTHYDPFLGCSTLETPAMEEKYSVPRSYQLSFGNAEDLDECYNIPDNFNLFARYEYTQVLPFTKDFPGDPHLTPTPKQFGMGFGFSSVDEGDLLLVDHPVPNVDPLLQTFVTPGGDGYILPDSHPFVELPMSSPSSLGSAPENSPWSLAEVWSDNSTWNLSASSPGSCNISDRGNSEPLTSEPLTSEPLTWAGASTPKDDSDSKLKESSDLLQLSLLDSFRYPCPEKSCTKSFKRKEHAKRHYITKHKPKTLYLRCEFCGKDTFTRQDNLNAHRRLHTRRPSHNNSGVHFIPGALQIIQNSQRRGSYNGKLISLYA